MTQTARPKLTALLPFSDDSTLFFAARMAQVLAGSGIEAQTAWLAKGSDLSLRQLQSVLPQGPDHLLHNDAFAHPQVALAGADMILTSRLFVPLRDMLRDPLRRHTAGRPAVMAFQGGLDFDAERGFANRRYADGVFVVPQADVARYRAWAKTQGAGLPQYVGFGHPTFLPPAPSATSDLATSDPNGPPRDITFFAQAISPFTRASRLFLTRVLAALARAHPDRTVWLKLRHLPGENTEHLHVEEHPYPDLIAEAGGAELPNLKLSAAPMDEILAQTGIGITCTSTAAIDLIRAGVPTMVFLDYLEAYLDPLVAPMRALFADSGLIASLDQLLTLAPGTPDPEWLRGMLCPADRLIQQIFEAQAHFAGRTDLYGSMLGGAAALR